MAYSKLHASIIGSSLWTEGDSVRILFITLLAMCDKDGCVYGTRPGISRIAMVDPDESDDAWTVLMSPDKHSSDKMRAPENEGRRIEEIPGGFRLLNFEYYRGLRNDDDRREQNRQAQARFKAKVSQGKPRSAKVSHDQPQKAHTEAETEAETDTKKKKQPRTPAASKIDFLDSLRNSPAYSKLDIDEQLGKMDAWLLAHPGRKKTPRFVVNWLNKAEPELPRQVRGEREQSMV